MAKADDLIAQVLDRPWDGHFIVEQAYTLCGYALARNRIYLPDGYHPLAVRIAALLIKETVQPFSLLHRESTFLDFHTRFGGFQTISIHGLRAILGLKRKKWKREGIK